MFPICTKFTLLLVSILYLAFRPLGGLNVPSQRIHLSSMSLNLWHSALHWQKVFKCLWRNNIVPLFNIQLCDYCFILWKCLYQCHCTGWRYSNVYMSVTALHSGQIPINQKNISKLFHKIYICPKISFN